MVATGGMSGTSGAIDAVGTIDTPRAERGCRKGVEHSVTEATISEVRDSLADLVNRVVYGHERVVLTRRGKQLAALVSLQDLELLEELEDKLDLVAAMAALQDPENRQRISWEQVKAELGL